MGPWILFSIILKAQTAFSIEEKAATKIRVLVTTSLLQDFTQNIVPENFEIQSLVNLDQDPHSFEPSPQAMKDFLQSDVLIYHGLGFEPWLDRMLKSRSFKGKQIFASATVNALPAKSTAKHHEHAHHQHSHSALDPHVWQDPNRVLKIIDHLAAELASIYPSEKVEIEKRTKVYKNKIQTLHTEIQKKFSNLPVEARAVVTTHDAFQYYGRAYDIRFFSAMKGTTSSDPSAKQIASLIQLIKKNKIRCLFTENAVSGKLMNTLQKETQARLGGKLIADGLSMGTAETYLKMMEHNAEVLLGCFAATKL